MEDLDATDSFPHTSLQPGGGAYAPHNLIHKYSTSTPVFFLVSAALKYAKNDQTWTAQF